LLKYVIVNIFLIKIICDFMSLSIRPDFKPPALGAPLMFPALEKYVPDDKNKIGVLPIAGLKGKTIHVNNKQLNVKIPDDFDCVLKIVSKAISAADNDPQEERALVLGRRYVTPLCVDLSDDQHSICALFETFTRNWQRELQCSQNNSRVGYVDTEVREWIKHRYPSHSDHFHIIKDIGGTIAKRTELKKQFVVEEMEKIFQCLHFPILQMGPASLFLSREIISYVGEDIICSVIPIEALFSRDEIIFLLAFFSDMRVS
jgi:hypothetical protein